MKNTKRLLLIIGSFSIICSSCSLTPWSNSKKITLYTRDTTSGTREGFFTTIGFSEAAKDNSQLKKGYIETAGNGQMIYSLRNDYYGIGYISLSSLMNSNVKAVKYGGVEPSITAVAKGDYKLKRSFNYVTRKDNDYLSKNEENIVKAFVAYMKTIEGQTTIISKDGIIDKNSTTKWRDLKTDYPICNNNNNQITIKFGGSNSTEKITTALAADFSSKCGRFHAEHEYTGSGDAYKRVQGGEKDSTNRMSIAFSSREFKITSSEPLLENTYDSFCIDAIVVIVNNKNPLIDIDREQLVNIYKGNIKRWNEIL